MQASPRESKELSAEGFNNRKGGLKNVQTLMVLSLPQLVSGCLPVCVNAKSRNSLWGPTNWWPRCKGLRQLDEAVSQ